MLVILCDLHATQSLMIPLVLSKQLTKYRLHHKTVSTNTQNKITMSYLLK